MLNFLPKPIIGTIAFILYVLSTVLLSVTTLIMMCIWLITPIPSWRRTLKAGIFNIPTAWSESINWISCFTNKTQWEIHGLENLSKDQSYLLISNHQGFLDILILQKILDRHIPQLRYFMKQGLLWLPIIGQVCYLMGYPFMKRYGKKFLKKHPEKRNADIETTRKTCERFKNTPISLINYVEGSRCTPAKQRQQKSPFTHLLKPKAGGIALILSAMGQQIDTIVNVTLIYPPSKHFTWSFIQGKMKKIIINIEQIPITDDLRGDYQNDREFRIYFQRWLNAVWQQKDTLIDNSLKRQKMP